MQEKILIKGIFITRKDKRNFLLLGLIMFVGSFVLENFVLKKILLTISEWLFWLFIGWCRLLRPIGVLFLLIFLCLFLLERFFSKAELIVSNVRVYGRIPFGKKLDLPLDKISAVGTSFLKGIDVGTSSGRIHLKFVKNRDEIYSVIGKLLIERQQAEKSNTAQNNKNSSNANEIRNYKELLDSGIITQEEFDEKKKQLLNL